MDNEELKGATCSTLTEDVSTEQESWEADDFELDHTKSLNTLMYKYKGPPVAPDEFRKINWIAMDADLKEIIANGMIPEDTLSSAGLDPDCYDHFKRCVTNIQESLWDGDLRKALSVLRGARRIFSTSGNCRLKFVFKGPPVEVLANLYFDGIGVLPKERMDIEDPYHHSGNPDGGIDDKDLHR